jgi:hypothetical protein
MRTSGAQTSHDPRNDDEIRTLTRRLKGSADHSENGSNEYPVDSSYPIRQPTCFGKKHIVNALSSTMGCYEELRGTSGETADNGTEIVLLRKLLC